MQEDSQNNDVAKNISNLKLISIPFNGSPSKINSKFSIKTHD